MGVEAAGVTAGWAWLICWWRARGRLCARLVREKLVEQGIENPRVVVARGIESYLGF